MRGDFRSLFVVLARVLHFIASEIENQLPKPSISATVTFTTNKGEMSMGEITVNEGDAPFSASVSYVNAKTGDPASASDTPVWSSADDSIASVESSADGLNATVTPVSSGDADGGTAVVISVVAHDAEGDEVRSEGTVTVRPDPNEVLIGEITFQSGAAGGGIPGGGGETSGPTTPPSRISVSAARMRGSRASPTPIAAVARAGGSRS